MKIKKMVITKKNRYINLEVLFKGIKIRWDFGLEDEEKIEKLKCYLNKAEYIMQLK